MSRIDRICRRDDQIQRERPPGAVCPRWKLQFPSKKDAKRYLKRRAGYFDGAMAVYRCAEGCNYWHLTHKKPVRAAERTRR